MSPTLEQKQSQQKALLIEQLKKTPIVQVVCEKLDISRATYYRWRKSDAEFAQSADEAIVTGSSLINDLAESQLISAIKDKNLTAIIFWLKHHHPTYSTRIELSGHLDQRNAPLTVEQEVLIERALKLAHFTTEESTSTNTIPPKGTV